MIIWIALSILIFGLITYYTEVGFRYDFAIVFLSSILSMLLAGVVALPLSMAFQEYEALPFEKTEYHLMALGNHDGGKTYGSFFLGCGYVSGKSYPVITYVKKSDTGMIELCQEEANNAIIFETKDKTPTVVFYKQYVQAKYPKLLFPIEQGWNYRFKTQFYIPPDSVSQGYSISVQ